jgi:outer membrane protein assembly factor BamE (lipoprotein component of BamABCDE complex)
MLSTSRKTRGINLIASMSAVFACAACSSPAAPSIKSKINAGSLVLADFRASSDVGSEIIGVLRFEK